MVVAAVVVLYTVMERNEKRSQTRLVGLTIHAPVLCFLVQAVYVVEAVPRCL